MSISTKQAINSENQIREIVDAWLGAVRTKDAETLLSLYAPEVVLFDIAAKPAAEGAVALRRRVDEWLGQFAGHINIEQRDLKIVAGDHVAFCHMYACVNGTAQDGTQTDQWLRATIGFEKLAGKWLVTHEHASVPIDMITGKADFGISP